MIRHLLSLIIALRCFQEISFGPEVDKLLYLLMVLLNSSLGKDSHFEDYFNGNSFKKQRLIWQFYAKLNIWCNTYQRLLILMQSYLLNCSASNASNLCYLTQFIRFHGLWFFEIIFWILSSKNICFVFLTTFLKIFQSSNVLENL